MSKFKEEKEIDTLDKQIQVIQIENFMDDFDTAMGKRLKNRFKKLALWVVPLTISIIGYLIFKNPLIITIGAGVTGASGITILAKDLIKDIKEMSPKNKSIQNISNITEEKDVDQILQEGIGQKEGKDFYTEEYKNLLKEIENYVETEQERMYREALEKQQSQNISSNISVVSNNEDFLNKDETMIQIVREIAAYTIAYNIPSIEIPNHQWDLYFDKAHQLFVKKGIESKFYDFMSQIGRLTFSKSLLNKEKKISIYDFIESLHYLKSEKISEKDILSLQKEILDKLPPTKIIDFSNYVNSSKKK